MRFNKKDIEKEIDFGSFYQKIPKKKKLTAEESAKKGVKKDSKRIEKRMYDLDSI